MATRTASYEKKNVRKSMEMEIGERTGIVKLEGK
jgi:hypothetical protein